jgi:hypothetical protein
LLSHDLVFQNGMVASFAPVILCMLLLEVIYLSLMPGGPKLRMEQKEGKCFYREFKLLGILMWLLWIRVDSSVEKEYA